MTESNQPGRAIVLAAGRGRRLRPHTDQRPKPLLPVEGRPILDYVLAALVQAEVSDVCLITNYLAEQIEAHVADSATICKQWRPLTGKGEGRWPLALKPYPPVN